jgi:hypothetical protein
MVTIQSVIQAPFQKRLDPPQMVVSGPAPNPLIVVSFPRHFALYETDCFQLLEDAHVEAKRDISLGGRGMLVDRVEE